MRAVLTTYFILVSCLVNSSILKLGATCLLYFQRTRIENSSIKISLSLTLDGNRVIRESIITFTDMKNETFWHNLIKLCSDMHLLLSAIWAVVFLKYYIFHEINM
jgi:hypothetical protein